MVDNEGTNAERVADEVGTIVAGVAIPLQRIREGVEGCSCKAALIDVGCWAAYSGITNA